MNGLNQHKGSAKTVTDSRSKGKLSSSVDEILTLNKTYDGKETKRTFLRRLVFVTVTKHHQLGITQSNFVFSKQGLLTL